MTLDFVGRKIPLVIGVMICGILMIVMTFCSEVYPTLLLLFIAYGVSLIPSLICPLQIDYLSKETMGASNAWGQIFALLGSTTATTLSL